MSQKERPIFWEVIVSIILSKTFYMNMCPIPNGFRDRAFECTTAKLLIRKRYYVYVLFLIPAFTVQVTESWYNLQYNKCSKIPPETVRNRTHVLINIFA